MLRGDGTPVLIDFGIAHQEGVSSGDTRMATGGYAPPEQLRGRSSSSSVDLYALGVVWAECYGGWEHVPEEWSEVLERLTHNHPSRRGGVNDLIEALQHGPEQRAELKQQKEEGERLDRQIYKNLSMLGYE